MNCAIELEHLTKTFTIRKTAPGLLGALRGLVSAEIEEVDAVSDLCLSIERGERVAFVGPNGAGKSTTIKMLSGILHPTSGHAKVAGFVPWKQRSDLAYRIGTVFGQRSQLWYHLPARDTLDLLAHVYECGGPDYDRRRAYLVDAFEIGAFLEKPVRQLSLGQRMRCEIVASLLHDPEIVFLDEPTIGLDVDAKATIRDVVREHSEREGRTVLLTSHDTGDMERVCDRVVVINHGRLLLDAPITALRSTFIRRKLVTLQTAEPTVTLSLPGVRVLDQRPHRTELEVDTDLTPVGAVVSAVLECSRLRDLTIADPPMDEVVQAIYRQADDPPARTGTD